MEVTFIKFCVHIYIMEAHLFANDKMLFYEYLDKAKIYFEYLWKDAEPLKERR